jgi:hypothetical protein
VVALSSRESRDIPVGGASTTDPTDVTGSGTSPDTTDTAGDRPEPWIEIWPTVIPADTGAMLTAVLWNPAGDEAAIVGCSGGALERDGATLDNDQEARADCDGTPVLPGTFSPEWTWRVPPLPPGTYDVRGARLVVTDEPIEPIGEFDRDEYLRFAGADLLTDPQVTIPDEVVVLGGNRLALRWTSACNQPAYDLRVRWSGDRGDGVVDRALVELRTAHFSVIDCVGEPSSWATVVDLPAPLRGASVAATWFDPGPGADAVVVEARRVDARPSGEPRPALVTMDREPLSYLDPKVAGGWISLRPFDGCGAWSSLAITEPIADTLYIQAYVPADNERCDGDWPPSLGFSTTAPPARVFGQAER